MRLGVPFIAPRQLGAVGGILGRQFLPSVGWHTGQSGAPPDIPCSLSGADRLPKFAQPTVEELESLAHRTLFDADRLPKLAQPTVEDLEPLAHRTLSGAHQTVRCPHQTVGSATHHARIAWPTIGTADRWLTGQSGSPSNSPMNFSRTPPMNSRERPVDQTPAWRTGHCPVCHRTVRCTQTAQSLGCSSQVFFLLYFL
jgi:hypothetical protein